MRPQNCNLRSGEITSVRNASSSVYLTHSADMSGCVDHVHIPFIDLSAEDCEHGVHAIPLVDTDALNANLALLALHLLRKHHPDMLPQLDLQSEATAAGLEARPPCRWEEHIYREPGGTEIDVVLDMGHNPAALAALARRIAHKFPAREVRYRVLLFLSGALWAVRLTATMLPTRLYLGFVTGWCTRCPATRTCGPA